MDKPTPITVELRASHRLGWLLGVAHSAAVFLLLWLPLPWWLIAVASAAVIASAASSINRQALRRGKHAVRALEFSDRETLRARIGDNQWHGGRLLGSSTVGAGLAVLNLRLDGKGTTHVVITGDSVDGDDFRRLRVWLRWGPGPVDSKPESS